MKYMLLIYQNPESFERLSEADQHEIMGEAEAIMNELMESGEWIGGEALADSSNTKTVRVRNDIPAVTDGPFAEAKEQMVGYCIIECERPERAVEIATRWPDARLCAMEVRPMMDPAGTEM